LKRSKVVVIGCIFAIQLATQSLRGQRATPVAFAAASIKPHERAEVRGGNMTALSRSPIRINFRAVTVGRLILFAYDFPVNRIEGRPDWLFRDYYDVIATSPASDLQTHKEMLQRLLQERFDLKVHRAMKEDRVYVLTPGKNFKLKSVAAGTEETEIRQFLQSPTVRSDGSIDFVYRGSGVSMSDVAVWLSGILDHPVTDGTQMPGEFDMQLAVPAIDSPGNPSGRGPATVKAAVHDQLGLELREAQGVIETLVIDHIRQKPLEN
jgi:uncharacterized protein (TIGR03435 family)